MKLRALPIFWQMLLLALVSLMVAQLATIALFVTGPPPRPDFVPLGEIADALTGAGMRGHRHPDRRLPHWQAATPPAATDVMTTDPALTLKLAQRMDRAVEDVRLFYQPDQGATFFYRSRLAPSPVPTRHGEPYFFNTVVAAVHDGQVWQVVHSPPKPFLSDYQERTILWFGISAVLMLPLVYLFTRRLTQPIRRFAAAVEQLDHDPDAPPVPVEGPAELQRTASALNAMQQRLHAYLRERSAMVGAIAHDLRTPLARITFRVESAPEPIRSHILGDVEQMRSMVATTMAFVRSGPGVGTRAPVDLAEILRRIGGHAQEMGAAIDVSGVEQARVMGDQSALERLFQNLIDNAIKYGRGAEIAIKRRGDRLVAEVADRGPGASPELLERIFEPFERGDPSRSRATGGLGLGLAIARTIAVAHGGTIRAENRASGGLRVIVELSAA